MLLQNLQELFHTWIQELKDHDDGSKPWPQMKQKEGKEGQTDWIQVIKFLLQPKPFLLKNHLIISDTSWTWIVCRIYGRLCVYLHMVHITLIYNKAHGT